MHYQNGREAKNGDQVVMLPQGTRKAVTGVLFGATPGVDTCNGNLAVLGGQDHYANLSECLHVDDIIAASKAGTIPDSSKA